jgi:hypothetical protein
MKRRHLLRSARARALGQPAGNADAIAERSNVEAVYTLQRTVGNARTALLLRDKLTETETELPADVKRYLEDRVAAAKKRLSKSQLKLLEAVQKNPIVTPEKTRGDRLVLKRAGETDRVVKVVRQLQEEARTGVVTMRLKRAGVRAGKKFLSKSLKRLERGDRVTLIRREGDWFFVRTTDGVEGWLNRSDLVLPPGMFPVQMNPEGWEHTEDDLEFKASPYDLPEGRYGEGTRAIGEDVAE